MTWADLPAGVKRLYPWEGAYRATPSGPRMHYLDEGTGEPLLMVHGNPTWSFYWREIVAAMRSTHRCIVPDHVGCGLSDKPQDWSYRLEDHIDNLATLIEALDLRDITLMVHDWGGAIGFGAALRAPERVKRLVVFNTAVFDGPLPLSIRLCRWPMVGATLIRGLNGFVRTGLLRATADPKRMRGDIAAGYTAPYGSWDDRIAHHRFVLDIPLEEGHPSRTAFFDIDKRLATFADRPMLLVWGQQDFCFTDHYRQIWMARFPSAEAHALSEASHWVVEDAHDRIVPWLKDFLERNP